MRGLALPLLIVLMLCGILGWQVAQPADPDDLPTPAQPAAPSAHPASSVQVWDSAALPQIADVILARPLFSQTRQPAAAPGAPAAATPPDDTARLTGIIIGPDRGVAIFSDAAGKPHAAQTGQSVGRETVRTIQPGQVTLVGSDGERVLHPSYLKPADGQPAVGPAPRGRER